MKKNLILLGLVVALNTMVFASDDRPASATGLAVVRNGAVFKVFYAGSQRADVKVAIYDESDEVVFSEVIRKTDGFVRPYNFSTMKEGDYTIELTGIDGRKSEKLHYRAGQIEKLANLMKLTGEEGKYLLTVSNKENDILTVRILDEASNKLLYSEKELISADFARIYNLTQLKGKVLFEISGKNGTITRLAY